MTGTYNKPVIGLCGGIGAGKTAVARMLEELGCAVAHSDDAARAAFDDPQIRNSLLDWWGGGILKDDGTIDRSAIAHIVFSDPEQRQRLEALTHPWIEARRCEQFEAAAATATALVIDAPLLLEVGLDEACDAVVVVDALWAIRAARVAQSRGWSEAELHKREESQLPRDLKRQKADYYF